MNLANNYVEKVKSKSIAEQVIASVYLDLASQQITSREAQQILEHVTTVYLVSNHHTTAAYLISALQRCTPEAITRAKKSVQAYMSYLVFSDFKEGRISLTEAETAKASIPAFLLQNKTDANKE